MAKRLGLISVDATSIEANVALGERLAQCGTISYGRGVLLCAEEGARRSMMAITNLITNEAQRGVVTKELIDLLDVNRGFVDSLGTLGVNIIKSATLLPDDEGDDEPRGKKAVAFPATQFINQAVILQGATPTSYGNNDKKVFPQGNTIKQPQPQRSED